MSKCLNLLLDLDQTLISAEATEEHDFKKYRQKSKLFNFENMDGYYIVYERPYLQEFLDFAFKNFNISIWTAASKDYALFIIDKIILKKPGRKLDWIFFSYHCDLSKKQRKGSKDLEMLWDIYNTPGYNKKNTMILDDYDEVYKTQPNNCIVAKPFEFTHQNSEKDNFLKTLIPKLDNLKCDEDVDMSIINTEMDAMSH